MYANQFSPNAFIWQAISVSIRTTFRTFAYVSGAVAAFWSHMVYSSVKVFCQVQTVTVTVSFKNVTRFKYANIIGLNNDFFLENLALLAHAQEEEVPPLFFVKTSFHSEVTAQPNHLQ